MKKMRVCALIVGSIGVLLALPVGAEMEMATTQFVLKGRSTGGELVLARVPEPFASHPYFVVTNFSGDDAATVLGRLALTIRASGYAPNADEALKSGAGLKLPGGGALWQNGNLIEAPVWIAGGNDRGFGIPPAPLFLSATCESNKVILKWVNDTAYDLLWVFAGVGMTMPVAVLPGNADRFEFDITARVPQDWPWPHGTNILFAVVGVKAGVPSTATAVRLVDFNMQEAVINVPFSHGVIPGFRFWAHSPTGAKAECRQEICYLTPLGGGTEIWRLEFRQVVEGKGGFVGGLYRRWFGLRPGHTYRVRAGLRAGATRVDGETPRFSLTLHAIGMPSDGKDLTHAQMAGTIALPGGSMGKTAGLIGRYGNTSSTIAQVTETSPDTMFRKAIAGTITLSSNSDSVALWLRVEGEDGQKVVVSLDSFAIENLGRK